MYVLIQIWLNFQLYRVHKTKVHSEMMKFETKRVDFIVKIKNEKVSRKILISILKISMLYSAFFLFTTKYTKNVSSISTRRVAP